MYHRSLRAEDPLTGDESNEVERPEHKNGGRGKMEDDAEYEV